MATIEAAFQEFTERKDIAILLINQHVCSHTPYSNNILLVFIFFWFQIAEKIRPTVDKYQQAFPALLEIPSKDHPYGEFRCTNKYQAAHSMSQIPQRIQCSSACRSCLETKQIVAHIPPLLHGYNVLIANDTMKLRVSGITNKGQECNVESKKWLLYLCHRDVLSLPEPKTNTLRWFEAWESKKPSSMSINGS